MLPVGLVGCVHPCKTLCVSLSSVSAFTLIELLIVIAIILILISIALPNFLEAQLRTQVTRVKCELRGIGTAMEAYFLDYDDYPASQSHLEKNRDFNGLYWLTTPTVFMSSTFADPFSNQWDSGTFFPYMLAGRQKGGLENWSSCLVTWVLFSCGPDRRCDQFSFVHPHVWNPTSPVSYSYSPTNGSRSKGDIFLWGGDPHWIGVLTNLQYGSDTNVGKCVDDVWYLHSMPPSLR